MPRKYGAVVEFDPASGRFVGRIPEMHVFVETDTEDEALRELRNGLRLQLSDRRGERRLKPLARVVMIEA